MTLLDVVNKIISVLPIDKYGHIVTVLHQVDLSTTTPTKYWGRSMLMRYTYTSLLKMDLLPTRRKIWLSRLVKRRRVRARSRRSSLRAQVMMIVVMRRSLSW